MQLWGITPEQARETIRTPDEDTGEWCGENGLATIYLEMGNELTFRLDSYSLQGLDNCLTLADRTRTKTYIEYVNSAVAVIYPA
jgi:hypothetical protein